VKLTPQVLKDWFIGTALLAIALWPFVTAAIYADPHASAAPDWLRLLWSFPLSFLIALLLAATISAADRVKRIFAKARRAERSSPHRTSSQ
jgi:hypothetical protein